MPPQDNKNNVNTWFQITRSQPTTHTRPKHSCPEINQTNSETKKIYSQSLSHGLLTKKIYSANSTLLSFAPLQSKQALKSYHTRK